MSGDSSRQSSSPELEVWYFGADGPWRKVSEIASRRRNTAVLEAIIANPRVRRVLVFNYVLRSQLLSALVCSLGKRQNTVVDICVNRFFPERWIGSQFWRWCNRQLMWAMIWLQVKSPNKSSRIIWSYWPAGFDLAQRVAPAGTWVFDADHDLVHDQNQSAGPRETVERLLGEVIQKTHFITAAAPSALKWFETHGARRVLRLRNGVSSSHVLTSDRPPRIHGTKPRIGYVGVLSRWVDYQLLGQLVAARPDWSFVIGGTTYRADLPTDLLQSPNVEFIGEIASQDLPDVLATFDVALGLYRCEPWGDVDSMKLFAYLAAGVPVVCSEYHPGLKEDFEGMLELAMGTQEFLDAVERVLQRDSTARKEWDEKRRRFVDAHTWAQHVAEAIEKISSSQPKCDSQ